ncbi:ATP-dependent DNA helicase [Candidatus Woesearchaeota archaeon]|nr:ATP-dependent DNA helicase [Candidatus Woesearchaeota archaeon]MBW2994224.1 ATP-dependent DNA helicase [Candidatus Woesearchaeota archaeon]
MNLKDIYFPHDKIRPIQDKLIEQVIEVIKKKKNLVVHAPTGLGKTAAAVAPALAHAMQKDLTVFFLTSRHTQHKIVIDTLKKIKKKYALKFVASSIIGKKWMCLIPNTASMRSSDFSEFCKLMRKEEKCEFYLNSRPTHIRFKKALEEIEAISPIPTEQVIEICDNSKVCPYEMSIKLASKSKVIVCDYNILFNPRIRDNLFSKTGKNLASSIIIIDEGHNLPARISELLTNRLSTRIVKSAIKEAKKYGFDDYVMPLYELESVLTRFAKDLNNSDAQLVTKEKFMAEVNKIKNYAELIEDFTVAGDAVLEEQKRSALSSIAFFLDIWPQGDSGFCRSISKQDNNILLNSRCLDPSIATKEVVDEAFSTILMSGTLSPPEMYADLLGFPKDSIKTEFPSPFPEENRLTMIIPKTTTKFTQRSETQFNEISRICSKVANSIPGNSAMYFPSYYLRDEIAKYFEPICEKTIFYEQPKMTKEEKQGLLERFKQHKTAVLLGVAAGSFGEGIDLPGVLKCVVVVGLPLDRPDLETKELIKYYDLQYGKGWDYGYVMPALTRTMQNAGRCIRSGTDRGVIIFLDQRYTWPNYFKCFPFDWKLKITLDYINKINDFFK